VKNYYSSLSKLIQFPATSPFKFIPNCESVVDIKGFVGTNVSKPEDWVTVANETVHKLESILAKITKTTKPTDLVYFMDLLSHELCAICDPAEFCRSTNGNAEMQNHAEAALGILSQILNQLNANTDLYNLTKKAFTSGELGEEEKHVLEKFILEFEHNGVHLKRKETVELHRVQNLYYEKSASYTRSLKAHDESAVLFIEKKHLSRFPKVYTNKCQEYDADRCVVKLTKHGVNDLVYHPDPIVRKTLYYSKYFGGIGSANNTDKHMNQLHQIFSLRQKNAEILNFETYVEMNGWSRYLKKPEQILTMLQRLHEQVSKTSRKDFENILKKKKQAEEKYEGFEEKLYPWDEIYLAHEGVPDDLSSYFSLGNCLEGLRLICDQLFSIDLVIAQASNEEVYHEPTVFKLEIYDKTRDNKLLGYVYMDLFARDNKTKTNATFPMRQSSMHSDVAIVAMVCRFKADRNPALLSLYQAETLFHEFGHVLHNLLSHVKYQHQSGSRVYSDFMETPSQFMEYFLFSYPVLSLFAKHYKTGEVLPRPFFDKIIALRSCNAAIDMNEEIVKAMIDILFHSKFNNKDKSDTKDIDSLAEELQAKYSHFTYPRGLHAHSRFPDHLLGYGGTYYSYLYSKLYAANIWFKCFQENPLSKESGLKVRKELFERGGSRGPKEIIQALLGQSELDEGVILTHFGLNINE
jgi:Zn-dependent oligopeptidase